MIARADGEASGLGMLGGRAMQTPPLPCLKVITQLLL
jgi:hypothetical protein